MHEIEPGDAWVKAVVDRHDPLGLFGGADAPDDEYEGEVAQIRRLLDAEQLPAIFAAKLLAIFGAAIDGTPMLSRAQADALAADLLEERERRRVAVGGVVVAAAVTQAVRPPGGRIRRTRRPGR